MTPRTKAWIRRETLISALINTVLSAAFFFLVFGGQEAVSLWGIGQWLFDFIPQSFMIALMSTLVPGALAAKALRAGKLHIDRKAGGPVVDVLPRRLFLRALTLALLSAAGGTALVSAVCAAGGWDALAATSALMLKLAYGALLALLVTPIGLRRLISAV